MMLKNKGQPFGLYWAFILIGFGWSIAVMMACSTDTEYKKVDFTEKVESSRPVLNNANGHMLRVAVAAMISPKETFIYYRELIDYLATRSNHEVDLIQRKTYGEVNEMLAKGQIDVAFICTGPYVTGTSASGFKAIATPIIRGKPFYQSYLIVHKDSSFQSFADLRGKNFAFTDPESNSGALVPRYWVSLIGAQPESFFNTFSYTYSHDNSILAVAKKLVDGAAVDSHIWEYYQKHNDFYVKNTIVIKKSEPFGSPPLVASDALDPTIRSNLVGIIMDMHNDPQGAVILSELMIDRFVEPKAEWYLPVGKMLRQVDPRGGFKNVAE
jgi:phosphonate transport system substrate-binding protein